MKRLFIATVATLVLLLSGCETFSTPALYGLKLSSRFDDEFANIDRKVASGEFTLVQAYESLRQVAIQEFPEDLLLRWAVDDMHEAALKHERGNLTDSELTSAVLKIATKLNEEAYERNTRVIAQLEQQRRNYWMGAMQQQQQQQQQMYRPAQPVNCVTTGHGRHAFTNCY